ncbi:UDP-Glycosyltransferase/glycogen phosphorylase, partial [Rozella allomycis CSF55]
METDDMRKIKCGDSCSLSGSSSPMIRGVSWEPEYQISWNDTLHHSHAFLANDDSIIIAVSVCKNCFTTTISTPSGAKIKIDVLQSFMSRLWLELDILPCEFDTSGVTTDERADSAVRKAIGLFGPNVSIPRLSIGFKNRVEVDCNAIRLVNLHDYEKICSEYLWKNLLKQVSIFSNLKPNIYVSFISSTPQGGGVALMRHALIRLSKLFQLNIQWYVVRPNPAVFQVTKRKIHNVLQGVSTERLTIDEKDLYEKWSRFNAERYWQSSVFKLADIIVLDDPQVVGLIPFIKEVNSECVLIYRSHIEIRTDLLSLNSSQKDVWDYLFKGKIEKCDAFISHPVNSFVPSEIDKSKVYFMPATTDPLDGLNKTLSNRDIEYYLHMFRRICGEQNMPKLDISRPYIVQISRFDPSKGIPDVINSYKILRSMLDSDHIDAKNGHEPQLVVCGHGSIDDPDGSLVYEQALNMIQNDTTLFKYRHDIIIARLPPSDQLLNTILRGAFAALQLSIREGFEIKVSEAIMKKIPIITTKIGGIPWQVVDQKNGFLVPPNSPGIVANLLFKLLQDKAFYNKIMNSNVGGFLQEEFTTSTQLCNWLSLWNHLWRSKRTQTEINAVSVKADEGIQW